MLGEELTILNHDIEDAVGEITNMASGAGKRDLANGGLNITAAIPTVVVGRNHTIQHVLGGPSIIIPCSTADGPFVVDICLMEQ